MAKLWSSRSATTAGGPAQIKLDSGGHGIIGMRERAALHGGQVETGPIPGGGFAVRARIPLEGLAGCHEARAAPT